jgi:hypothetical protein
MKQVAFLLIVLLPCSSFSQPLIQPECARLSHFFTLKEKTAKKYWPGFASKLLFGPMLYYSNGRTYVINPNKRIKERLAYTEVENCIRGGFIGKVAGNIDTVHFNMQVDYEEDDSAALHYFNAIASVSDIGIAKAFVPQIQNIEEWMGMMLHESFHLYQTGFPEFKAYQNGTQAVLSRDTLLAFYKTVDWYKESIQKEYDMLLHALNTTDKNKVIIIIENFLNARDQRFQKIQLKYGTDIRLLEDMLERSEGVARYMEYCMKRVVNELPLDKELQADNPLYIFGNYANYQLQADPFMNKLGTQYYYAMGLQLSCLLEKMGIDFRNMYRNNIPFERYLKQVR